MYTLISCVPFLPLHLALHSSLLSPTLNPSFYTIPKMPLAATATAPVASGQTVCVTGAGGFIASWLVKLLLQKGYNVRGTVRNPDDVKNVHLKELDGAKERLTLYGADLFDYESLKAAIVGCDGVFHTASPVTDDPEKVEQTIMGTKNIIMAAAEAKVGRVVYTSSIGTVYMNPNRSPDMVVDESCWSDLNFCKNTKNWYCYGKTVAEETAWVMAKEKGLDLVVINPMLVLGPLLQHTIINASVDHIMKYLTGSAKTYVNAVQGYVHVKDVAKAHVLVYETPSASGRYICVETMLHRGELVEILAKFFPEYPIPTKCSDQVNPWKKPYKYSVKKLKDLGMEFIPVKQCIYETVKSLQHKGHLPFTISNPTKP